MSMVNNAGFTGFYNSSMYNRDIENIVKYATGASLTNNFDEGLTFGNTVVPAVAFSAIPGGLWAFQNRKDLSGGYKKFVNEANAKTARFQANGGLKSIDAYKRLFQEQNAKNIIETVGKSKIYAASKGSLNSAVRAEEYAKQAIKAQTPEEASKLLKRANKYRQVAEYRAYAAKYSNPKASWWTKLKKALGFNKVGLATKKFALKSPTFTKIAGAVKGNAGFAAISGGIALFTQVIPTFSQLGFGKGVKQTAKSAVKVGAEVAGWALGAKAGAVVGSAFGPVGTVVGGVIGFIGGMIGSHIASKAAEKIVGKDELAKVEDEQNKNLAKQAKENPEVFEKLMVQAAQRMQAEGDTSDSIKVANSYKNIAENVLAKQYQNGTTPQAGETQQTNSSKAQTSNPYMDQAAMTRYNPLTNSMMLQTMMDNRNPFASNDMMDKDFMAMAYGIQ